MNAPREEPSRPRTGGHQPLLCVLVAMGIGILIDRYFAWNAERWWLIALGALAAWGLLWWFHRLAPAAGALLVAVAGVAGCWHHAYWHLYPHDTVARSVDDTARPMCLQAIVESGPRWVPAPPSTPLRTIPRGESSRLELRLLAVRDGQVWKPISGKASLAVDGHLLGLACGDRLMLFALADRPPGASGPGEFDFRRFLRGQRQQCQLASGFPDCVRLEQAGSPWRLDRWLARVKRRGTDFLEQHVGPQHAPLAIAMILGDRDQLDRKAWDTFVETGSVHLLAISGLHVGILAFGLFALARGLCLRQSTALAMVIGITLFYALLVELRPPVVRATVIIVIMCLARWRGRSALSFNSLAAAGIVVLALNPSDLYRIGPQFSFLAVGVLCATSAWFSPPEERDPLRRLIARSRPWYWRKARQARWQLFRLVGASAAIWLVAMPLTMYHYHLCAPIALVVYPLVAAPVALAMLSGFGVLVLGGIAPPLAAWCGELCSLSLGTIELVVNRAHEVPGAYLWLAGPSLGFVVAYYLLLAGFAAARQGQPEARWPLVMSLSWVALLTLGAALAERRAEADSSLACTFVNVGHGTGILVELPGGKRLLYDAGSLGEPTSGERPISAVLWSRGVTHLDAMVISHADADHYNAIPGLLDRFSVGVVYVSPVMFESDAPALRALRESIASRGVALREIYAGDRIGHDEEAVIEVLHPPRRGVAGSDNANSIVLDIAFAGKRILLPGDLESPGIDDVMAEEPRGYQVIMAPHHGSASSNPQGFAAWSRPQYVVISGGRSSDVRAVRTAYEQQGATTLFTAHDGAVRVEIDRDDLKVRTWRGEPW